MQVSWPLHSTRKANVRKTVRSRVCITVGYFPDSDRSIDGRVQVKMRGSADVTPGMTVPPNSEGVWAYTRYGQVTIYNPSRAPYYSGV